MRIDHTNRAQPLRAVESKSDGDTTSTKADAKLEDQAGLSALANTLGSAPDVREQRIEMLRAAVESGTYTIDSQDLAASLIHAHSIRVNKRN